MNNDPPKECSKCGGTVFRKKGRYMNSRGTYQNWQCKWCAKCVMGGKI